MPLPDFLAARGVGDGVLLAPPHWLAVCAAVLARFLPDVARRLRTSALLARPFPDGVVLTVCVGDTTDDVRVVDATWQAQVRRRCLELPL